MTTKTRTAKPASATAAADLNVGMVANPRRTRI
jgi:hypothetical protein